MTTAICDELADIILQMKNGDQPWIKGILPNYKTPLLMLEKLSHPDQEAIKGLLREDSNRRSVQHEDYQPYISIMRSYAYCMSDDKEQSLRHAKIAVDQFHRSPDQWDRAMAHWFLGIAYKINEFIEESEIELENAIRLLEEHSATASRKYNFDTSRLCLRHIDKIKENIKRLQNLKTHLQAPNKLTVPVEAFSEILELLTIHPELNYLEGWRDAVTNMDTTSLPAIKSLMSQINELVWQTQDSPTENAIIRALLSHCYNISYYTGWEHIPEAEACITEAISQFRSQNEDYNQAISHWYLGLIHQNFSETKTALLNLSEADRLFERFAEKYQETDYYNEIQSLRSHVLAWIDSLEPQDKKQQYKRAQKSLQKHKIEKSNTERSSFFTWLRSSQPAPVEVSPTKSSGNNSLFARSRLSKPVPPEATSYPQKNSDIKQVRLQSPDQGKNIPPGPPPEGRSKLPGGNNKEPLVEHIIIPVDLRALRDKNPKLHPLDSDLFEKLHQYEEKIAHNHGENDTQSAPKPSRRKPISIPRFPLYGQVAAGPNGEPNLDSSDLEIMEEVKDDIYINLEGQKHEVMFVNNEQIAFIRDRHYGWLKVVGQSMNNCFPIPVNDGDYVLFSENRNANSCLYKIVVAGLFEIYNQLPQLVVKRLLRNENFPPEYPEFVLHSESLLEEDPRTGRNYKEDIPVVSDDQIAGEVIAIAKRI